MGAVTALARPDVAMRESWAAAMLELGDHAHGSGWVAVTGGRAVDLTAAGCAAYVAALERLGEPGPPRAPVPPGHVPTEYWWVVDGDPAEVVGFLALRRELDAWHREVGGHLGYSIRPGHRGRGHASRAVRLALARAAELGIDRLLVTCVEDNVASRRVVERCGGVLEDVRRGTSRYRLPTGRRAAPPASPTAAAVRVRPDGAGAARA
ncbi:GNAT family N-acetyltransferase [Nocardioides abyssi]|uniref:GNAT family N-acetyltransferase n=1 Tax=Nocardioides abyssi TaxID=3058370 RepID=A0ABT8EYT8_9ACTN|nr:GNAT family N-acetyltransferase [Nocardioides abyssi]MDN4163366.1 GNAT family N-acetyltransferase [Nocardioides abyssi]